MLVVDDGYTRASGDGSGRDPQGGCCLSGALSNVIGNVRQVVLRQHVRVPASPRGAIAIAEAARAAALLAGRPNVDFADVQRVARPALAHRLVLQHRALVAGVRPRDLVAALLEHVPAVGRALPEVAR